MGYIVNYSDIYTWVYILYRVSELLQFIQNIMFGLMKGEP
jgi:hypothetical protein